MFTIGVNRAVTLIADKKAGKGGRFGKGAPAKQILKELGEHPELGGKIEVLNGRYGPYIAHNKVFANVPKGTEPTAVTVDQAVRCWPNARPRAVKKAKKAPAKKAPAKKAAAKSEGDAPKKPAAKKAKASKAKADADAD